MKEEHLGQLFKDNEGRYWRLVSYCALPTATLERVGSMDTRHGAVGSLIMRDFTEVPSNEAAIVEKVVEQTRATIDALKELEMNSRIVR